ncbi:hypothetical protein QQ054_31835 [Oscillatoria amoena NRMC-F 0135]|nr:hypothetical protein [Oscillatoria amoena NRMC-F 0135]
MKSKNRVKKLSAKSTSPSKILVPSIASTAVDVLQKPKFVFCTSCGVRLTELNHLAPFDGVCAACKTAQGQKEAEAARRKQSQTVAGLKHSTYVRKALKAIEPWLN